MHRLRSANSFTRPAALAFSAALLALAWLSSGASAASGPVFSPVHTGSLVVVSRVPHVRLLPRPPSSPRVGARSSRLEARASSGTLSINAFDGLDEAAGGGYTPSDVQIGAGPGHIAEMVNDAYEVWAKPSLKALGSLSLDAFWGKGSDQLSDPQLLFDPVSGRWFTSALDVTSNQTLIGVSSGTDPTGSWILYGFNYGQLQVCPDQPKLGTSDSVVVVTVALFSGGCRSDAPSTEQGGFVIAINKQAMVAASSSPSVASYGPNNSLSNIAVARTTVNSSVAYLAAADSPNSTVIHVSPYQGAPPNGGFGQGFDTAMSYKLDAAPNAAQLGSSALLDTGDDRIDDAVWRNGILYVAANDHCAANGSIYACVRLAALSTSGHQVLGETDLGAAGLFAYYGAIALDSSNRVFVSFGYSSSNAYPSSAVIAFSDATLRQFTNYYTMSHAAAPVDEGDGSSVQRMGDYFGAATDPTNPALVWVASEYGKSQAKWGTAIASATYASPPPPPQSLPFMSFTQARIYVARALSGALGGTFKRRSGYSTNCSRVSSSRVRCSVAFVSGTNTFYGGVTVYYLLSNGTVYWNDNYTIHWASRSCVRSSHPGRCKVHTKSGS